MVMTMVQVGPVLMVVGYWFMFMPVGMTHCTWQTFMMVIVVKPVMPVNELVGLGIVSMEMHMFLAEEEMPKYNGGNKLQVEPQGNRTRIGELQRHQEQQRPKNATQHNGTREEPYGAAAGMPGPTDSTLSYGGREDADGRAEVQQARQGLWLDTMKQ